MPSGGLHRWDVSPKEAVEIQHRLRSQLDLQGELQRIDTVAGIDVSYNKGSDWLYAAIVVLRLADLHMLGSATATAQVPFPPSWLALFSRVSRCAPGLGKIARDAGLPDV